METVPRSRTGGTRTEVPGVPAIRLILQLAIGRLDLAFEPPDSTGASPDRTTTAGFLWTLWFFGLVGISTTCPTRNHLAGQNRNVSTRSPGRKSGVMLDPEIQTIRNANLAIRSVAIVAEITVESTTYLPRSRVLRLAMSY